MAEGAGGARERAGRGESERVIEITRWKALRAGRPRDAQTRTFRPGMREELLRVFLSPLLPMLLHSRNARRAAPSSE